MATDRQTPCLYYVCAGLCKKGRKADHAHYCQHCNKYKPRARVRYRNQKKEKLEKIRKRGIEKAIYFSKCYGWFIIESMKCCF